MIHPTGVDARTDFTTQLLSDTGFAVSFTDDTDEDRELVFEPREFET